MSWQSFQTQPQQQQQQNQKPQQQSYNQQAPTQLPEFKKSTYDD